MMLTNTIDMTSAIELASAAHVRHRGVTDARTVVIVNGGNQMSELLETAVDAGRYDVVFVESVSHAYSQIKKVQPDLVIISIRMDDADGVRVLSMLKLDPDTCRIPVLTHAADQDEEEGPEEHEPADEELFARRRGLRMN